MRLPTLSLRTRLAASVILLLPLIGSSGPQLADARTDDLITVFGMALDETTGSPLRGAAIAVGGLPLGTLTDSLGRYVLHDVPNRNLTLTATRLGYIPELRQIWVCTPDSHPLGDCVPLNSEAQGLRFYLRPIPRRGSGGWPNPAPPPTPLTTEVSQ